MRTLAILCFLALTALAGCGQSEAQRLILATTTSTYDSGLLDLLLPAFEEMYHAEVDVIAVGTGQALALGAAGDADVLLVHAPELEAAFVEAGDGLNRQPVMYNDFVILGPAADPAAVRGGDDAQAALAEIARQEALFVSRGDDSGTHLREQDLWEGAGIAPEGEWYQVVGQGMGATLTLADEQQAYTLSDRGTFILRRAEGLELEVLVEGDPRLANPYGIIIINPERHPHVNEALARQFVEWLTSSETQQDIAAYRIEGEQLFYPFQDSGDLAVAGQVAESELPGNSVFLTALRAAFALIFSRDSEVWEIVLLTLIVSGTALLLAALLGIPTGAWLGLRSIRGQRWITASIYTGMGLPPVVVGLVIYLLLSRQGAWGRLDLLFTPPAMILAQLILALPLIIGVTMAAVRGVGQELRMQLRSLGATERQVTGTTLYEARYGVIVGLVAAFGAAISEVGAVMIVGGNIAGKTRVLTTAIVLETRRGQFELALALGIILLLLAFVANTIAVRLQADS